MQDGNFPNSTEPLVMRSYRRHRKQSRWGTYSLVAPLLTLLWCVFWYLMMSQPSLGPSPASGVSVKWIAMMAGIAVISLAGSIVAVIGFFDSEHRHERAAISLAINAVVFTAACIIIIFRMFSQSVS